MENLKVNYPDESAEILWIVYQNPIRSKDLTDFVLNKFKIKKGTVYNLIDKLIKLKLIRRVKKSRKFVYYKITDEGKIFVNSEVKKSINRKWMK